MSFREAYIPGGFRPTRRVRSVSLTRCYLFSNLLYLFKKTTKGFYLFFSSLDENEDPVTGLERVASYSSIDAEERRQRRLQQEQRLAQREEARRKQEEEVALSARYESLDYEIVENQLYRSEEKDPNHQVQIFWFPKV